MKAKNFRKRRITEGEDEEQEGSDNETRLAQAALEEVKFLQRQREKKCGLPALQSQPVQQEASSRNSMLNNGVIVHDNSNKGDGDVENDELVLQDTFAQETAVMVEDPNMVRYVEQELAKKRGKNINVENQIENDVKRAEDELYKIPEHLKVKKRNSEEHSTQWTTGIAEIQLPIEYKLRNIEETEAAKKLLQEKRLVGHPKAESSIPSSFSADFFQRGKDYAEKHRKEHPQLNNNTKGADTKGTDNSAAPDGAVRRQAATDELMLDRFRKRERQRLVRR